MSRSRKSNRSMQHIRSGVKGVVKSYQPEDRRYGFITDGMGTDDVFFHISAVRDQGLDDPIREGDEVIFDLYLAPKGYRAESVLVRVEESDDDMLYGNDWFRGSAEPEGPRSTYQNATSGDGQGQSQTEGENVKGWNTTRRKRGGRVGRNRGCRPHASSAESKPQPPKVTKTATSSGGPGKENYTKPTSSAESHPQPPKVTKTATSSGGPGKEKYTKPTSSAESHPQPPKVTKTATSSGGPGKEKYAKPETSPSSNHSSGNHACGEQATEKPQPSVAASHSTELSWSTKQRERGNIFYKSATDDFSATVRISRLENAVTCYKHALSCSNNQDEEASASKNIGMASWKLAAIALESETEEADEIILKHFKEALKYFCMAYVLRSHKSVSWGDKLEESWENCLDESTEWLADRKTTERIAGFSELLGYVPDCRLKANGYIQYSTLLFHEGLTAWQDGEYKECYRYMRECYYPIQEAERLCEEDSDIKTEVDVLREDVYIHTCVAESSMARATGDDLLEEHLKNEETMNTNTVWTVIDFYKQAAVLCRDKDLEQEAIAYSRLGRVYGSVLNLSSRGKDYYKRAIQLALSMTPRTFHGVDWFKESTEFVEDFQKRLNKDEEEDKDKEAALKEMKADIDKLSKMADEKDDVDFVKDLYKTWPPKTPGAEVDDKLTTKKLVLKAISHYHPDKVDKEVHGKNWFYFSGEITKHLNIKYACYKSVD